MERSSYTMILALFKGRKEGLLLRMNYAGKGCECKKSCTRNLWFRVQLIAFDQPMSGTF